MMSIESSGAAVGNAAASGSAAEHSEEQGGHVVLPRVRPERAAPDPKPPKRYRASKAEWNDIRDAFVNDRCWVCDDVWTELHHILNRSHSGDDVVVNLAPVCGPCHLRIEAREPVARSLIRQALLPSNYAYLRYRLGETLEGWLERNYAVDAGAYTRESHAHAGATTNQELNQVLDLQAVSKRRLTTTPNQGLTL